jgi:hypothetical protein
LCHGCHVTAARCSCSCRQRHKHQRHGQQGACQVEVDERDLSQFNSDTPPLHRAMRL